MGCFLGCFGGSKDRKPRKQRNKVIPRDQRHGSQKPLQITVSSEQGITEKPVTPVSELRDNSEEHLSLSTRKRVTFDSIVTTYEHVSICESVDSLPERGDTVSEKDKEESLAKTSHSSSLSEDDSVTSSVGSYPPNHRYQNFRDSDDEADEYGDTGLDDEDDEELECYGDYDEDDYDRIEVKEVWCESIPTASMESRTDNSAREIMEEVESQMTHQELKSNRNARDRSAYVHPVLNPVENITQWKAVKSKNAPPLKPQNKNFTSEQEAPHVSFSSEPSFKQPFLGFKPNPQNNFNQEVAVDASLSNWLVSSETTPVKKTSFTGHETITSEMSMSQQGSNSVMSLEDRPILGALTVEEIRQFSASCSPRRSPSRSPDEIPLIGTVGTYWSHTGQTKDSGSASSYKGIPNTTSKYREDKRVNWHSTPFETRLERALIKGTAEA
ncbi:unnamed protein product [Ilex paraguariensis]|uniref:Eisosome protein SEG2 n=1 Tax=Ilex paraguariensis TaxID=185542 RepID=A0ABC8SYC3_9AQUA